MKDSIDGMAIRRVLSKNLKRLRGIANLSQVKLAAEADLAHNFINDIENCKKWISPETLGKLATALEAEPYQFFISNSKWNERGAEIFSLYLSDFEDSFEKMLAEYRGRFIGSDEKSKLKED